MVDKLNLAEDFEVWASSNTLSLCLWILMVLLRSSIKVSSMVILVCALFNSCFRNEISAASGDNASTGSLCFARFLALEADWPVVCKRTESWG